MGSHGAATILHADLDAFYASVAQLRHPELRGLPVIVGGGVVLSASYEARRFGVRSGMSGNEARRLCPRARWVSGEFDDYVDLSTRVFDVFRDFTPLVEPVSIDEAFLDVGGARRLLGTPPEIAARVRAEVRERTGLIVSIGVARTKFLAKVASQVAKPDGLVVVDPGAELEFLHPLPVGYVWGIGPVTNEQLAGYGIGTVGELAAVPVDSLVAWLGPGAGRHLHALAWNRDPRGVVTRRRAKSVGAQSAFGRRAQTRVDQDRVLANLADRVGRRLRAKGYAGRTVTVRARLDDFRRSVSRSYSSQLPVATAASLYRVADDLLEELREEHPPRAFTLLAITASRLVPRRPLQMELPLEHGLAAVPTAGTAADLLRDRLEASVDELRERFGRDMVGPGATMLRRRGAIPQMGLLVDAVHDASKEDPEEPGS